MTDCYSSNLHPSWFKAENNTSDFPLQGAVFVSDFTGKRLKPFGVLLYTSRGLEIIWTAGLASFERKPRGCFQTPNRGLFEKSDDIIFWFPMNLIGNFFPFCIILIDFPKRLQLSENKSSCKNWKKLTESEIDRVGKPQYLQAKSFVS